MALNINNIKLKKSNVINTKENTVNKCKRINVNGVKVWVSEVTLPNLNGWAASGGGPDASDKWFWRQVDSGEAWDLSDFDTIVTMSGYASPAMEYWQGGDYIKGTRYIYLVFADGTTKEIARWDYGHNYFESDTRCNWSVSHVDISAYTAEQKKSVRLRYANNVYCDGNYGSFFTELFFETTTAIAS